MSQCTGRLLASAAATILVLAIPIPRAQAAAPVKLVLSSHIGWEANRTTKGNVCTLASKDECQPTQERIGSVEPGGFKYPEDASGGAPGGSIYVADRGNNRVQELDEKGQFVLMFGVHVNKKGGNICTAAEASNCQAGERGGSAEAFASPQSVAVDPGTGNLYVLDHDNWRIDEYTGAGQFVLTIGRHVNRQGGNLCTAAEASNCQAGERSSVSSKEGNAFNFETGQGDLLAVGGGSERLLYVGDEHRIQEIDAAGEWKGEIALPASVQVPITAIAVDPQTETVYVVINRQSPIREYDPATKAELEGIEVRSIRPHLEIEIPAIAIDGSDHLAVWAYEVSLQFEPQLGYLYQASSGRLLTEFKTPGLLNSPTYGYLGVSGIGFNVNGGLYASLVTDAELWSYRPVPVAEPQSREGECRVASERETDVALNCLLTGEVNPWGVSDTEAFFEWGRTPALGSKTSLQSICTTVCGSTPERTAATVEGVPPGEYELFYKLDAYDANNEPPEASLQGCGQRSGKSECAPESFPVGVVAPRIVPEKQTVSFVGPSSAVLLGQLNPENAHTEYLFEYAPQRESSEKTLERLCPHSVLEEREACEKAGVMATATFESRAYGKVGATAEISGLAPGTPYKYRLAALNGQKQSAVGETEAEFTTSPAPVVQAQTGGYTVLSPTSAMISGTVDPDGQATTYQFELGVYNGAATQYGIVFSGSAGTGTTPVGESLLLTGLQSGTTYAYRIAAHFGEGDIRGSSAIGAPAMFITPSLPSVLSSPAALEMLPVPPTRFPSTGSKPGCKRHGYVRDRRGRCVKLAKHKHKRKRNKKAGRR